MTDNECTMQCKDQGSHRLLLFHQRSSFDHIRNASEYRSESQRGAKCPQSISPPSKSRGKAKEANERGGRRRTCCETIGKGKISVSATKNYKSSKTMTREAAQEGAGYESAAQCGQSHLPQGGRAPQERLPDRLCNYSRTVQPRVAIAWQGKWQKHFLLHKSPEGGARKNCSDPHGAGDAV